MIGQFHNAQSSLSPTGQHDIQSGITTGSTVSWQRWPESRKWSCYAVVRCVQSPERLSGCLALTSICNHPSSFFALRHHTSCAASSHKHPLEWFNNTQRRAPLQGFPRHPDAKIQSTRSIQHYNDTELLISRIVAFQCIRSSGKNGPVLATPWKIKLTKDPCGHRHNIDMNHMNPRNQK